MALRAELCFEGLCKKVFAAFGGRIFFGWRLVFHDFASRNHEKQVSIQILFGAKRQEEPFYTTPQNNILARSTMKRLFTQPRFKYKTSPSEVGTCL